MSLGLVEGATPALAERAAWLMSSSGMTQGQTLARLRQDHGVGWGVKKLRQVTEAVSERLAEQRHEVQVAKLLEWLEQAAGSKGKRKPVLSVGRDGITLGIRTKRSSLFEVATTGTVTVLDRRGRRLGTVYLGYTPEPGQATMSRVLPDSTEAKQSQHVRGHCNYYGITGNSFALSRFRDSVERIWKKWLSRRKRRGFLSWYRFRRLLQRFPLPPARAVHSVCRLAGEPAS